MKSKVTKLTDLQVSLLISGMISIFLLLVSCIGFFFNQSGWTIGVCFGAFASLVYIFLVNKGSTLALKDAKAGLSMLFYFVRMIIFVGLFAMLVILQYKANIDAFKYSCWGMLIAFFPSTLITVGVQLKYGKEK